MRGLDVAQHLIFSGQLPSFILGNSSNQALSKVCFFKKLPSFWAKCPGVKQPMGNAKAMFYIK
jgi:hypothetical protein